MLAFPRSLTVLRSSPQSRDLRSIRSTALSLDYSLGSSGGLAILAGLFLRCAAALSLPRGRGCTYVSTHLKPSGSFSSRSASSAQGVAGWSSTTRRKSFRPRGRRPPPSHYTGYCSSGTSRQALNFGLLNLGGSFFIRAQAQLYS